MKNWLLLIFALGVITSFQLNAFADEGHPDNENSPKATESSSGNELEGVGEHSEGGHLKEGHEGSEDKEGTSLENHSESVDHEDDSHGSGDGKLDHGEDGSHDEADANHDEQGDHGHAEEKAVEEGPNFRILGTFGAINLSFLLMGVWNKRIRRKGE